MMSYHVFKTMAIMLHAASSRALPWTSLNGCKELLCSQHCRSGFLALTTVDA